MDIWDQRKVNAEVRREPSPAVRRKPSLHLISRTVTDNLGNKVSYSYDTRGNRTKEDVTDPSNTLVRTVETVHDIRNRVASINAGGSITTLIHDALGNLTRATSPNQQGQATPKTTTHEYDALNRLTKTIDTLGGTTTLAHTPTDAPASVTAPNAANTTYTHDDLGRRLTETSPDRGTTTYTHDLAGNVLTLTDARNVTVTYTYDAANRMTKATYPDATLTVTYTYDSGTTCTNGVGRLCLVTDASGTTTYAYDAYGNITEHKKTELGVTYSTKYSYDNADRILTITYPDNRIATYTRDILGRITQVSFPVNGTPTILTKDRTYRADGLLLTQTAGSGLTESKTYDPQGRLTTWTLGGETRAYTYDANSNVATRTTPTESRSYVYDPEDRLTEDRVTAGTGTTQTLVYDLNGNRTKLNTTAYTYAANSNRLTQIGTKVLTLDPAGNTTKDNLNYNYVYYANGTLKEARSGTTLKGTYTYNHRFQRTRKVAGTATTVYHYDLTGNLIAETRSTGVLIRAYVHDDQAPIAQVTKGTTDTLVHLHTDHLNTPRLATDAARSTVWRYDGNAFGDTLPNEDPDGNAKKTTVNLRFPGQYYDAETKLHYNWHRYYDPRIGRYVTSDPIGLEGGLNTYAYVGGNPLRFIDPHGLVRPGQSSIEAQIESAIVRGDVKQLQTLLQNGVQSGSLAPAQEMAIQAGIRSIEIIQRTTNSTTRLAELLGRRQKEIKRAIEQCKQEGLPRGGPIKNPNVRVDPRTGEVYPELPGGKIGDSIGNIFQYLK